MMKKYSKTLFSIVLFFTSVNFVSASEAPGAEKLFKQKCSLCHAIDKRKLGPAVNTMSNKADVLRQAISKGRKSMPPYEGKLTSAQINGLVEYLLTKQ